MPTTRRKSVATSKAKGKAPPATPKPKDTPGIPHIVSSSTTTEQHKHGAKSTSTKTIITETVVQQSRVGGQASYSPLRSPSLADELDPWEVLPKTGYTYAQSPSYSQLYLNCDDWVVPNMSRPRIRGGAPLSITPSSSSSMSSMGDLLSVSQANVHTQHGGQMSQSDPVATEGHMRQSAYESRQAALQGSYMGHISTSRRKTQNIRTLDKDYEETLAYEQSLPTSVTRSGRSRDGTRRSTRLRDSTSRTDADMTDMTVDEYMQLEKQMEYSGHAGPRKESSRLSLYGLDRADEIEMSSDTEVTHIRSSQSSRDRSYQVNSSSSYTVITSYMWSLVTTIVTICSTVVETSWNLATTPVRWLASSAETTSGYLSRWCWSIGVWIHGFAARILLLDVWLLSSSRERRRGACCCLLPLLLLLLLLPFLVPASRYIFTPITKTQSGASLLVSEKVEAASAAGISGIALREIIEQELAAAKVDLKTHGEHLYADNLAYIERLEKEIERQGVLLAGLKDCCKNDTALVGLIRDGVHHQLAAIMQSGGSDAGAAGGVGGSTNKEGFSNAAFVTWLNTQFSESSDFDAKIAALTVTLNQGLKEQADAAKAAMLAAVQAEQAAKDANGESNRAAGLAVSVQEAQGTQGAAWTKDKAHLEGLIAGVASDLKNIDDRANSAAIAAAAATDTANTAAVGASTAVAQAAALAREQAESQSAAAAAGIGVGSGPGCGCDSQNVVLPDNYQTISEDQVKLLIREALGIFGADKTGMVDYALESAGGSVISTRCSETYHRRTAQLSLFGIPLWYMSNSPRTVIQPDVQPGQCWAFKGTEGNMVIQLAGWVKPNAFSMEHIPKVLSPTGKIDSAPKDFTVWGLQYERDTEGVLLGNYTYLDNGEPLQFFTVRDSESDAFHVIELRIHSNHGNQEYTCLYRFRVHGVLKKT